MPAWLHADHYWLARLLVQRSLGAIYFIAFLVALNQFRPLLGEHGLTPVARFLEYVRFREAPSIFHFHYSDRLLVAVAITGMALSFAVVVGLPDRWPVALTMLVWLVLWTLYLSIVNVGQRFYSFGWETLLLEAGFLAIFLGPAWAAVPAPLIWAFRWLLVRVELGAGLIKMRGDRCWRDLTCLYYHHETQPMPNALSWFFHRLPKPFHKAEVLGSHFAQLVAPVMLFLPQPIAGIGALVMAATQAWLVLSGNFSWLNVVTIALTFSAMDDGMLGHVLTVSHPVIRTVAWQDGIVIGVTLLILVLSYRPAKNLVSRDQMMNASFDSLHLVNTYGAFGSVTKFRYEIVVEGTLDDPGAPNARWLAYEFRGKPTDPKRRPRQWAPYHLRLDWLMWFAALSPARELEWFVPFLVKLLEDDRPTLRLLAKNPFAERAPRAVRAVLYLYHFTSWRERRETGNWWRRTSQGQLFAPLTLPPSPASGS
jgi:hypothetical protein